MSLEYKLKILNDRAVMMKKVRSFFYNKKITEVDPPALIKHPSMDEHIQSIETKPLNNNINYLHTSPEYTMKRLIANGLKNIYFLGHVFRKNEIGQNHNPEFTMIEWYKSNISFENFLNINVQLIKLFINFKKIVKIQYFKLFLNFFNLNIFKCTKKILLNKSKELKIIFSNKNILTKDDLLSILLNYFFEKKAKKDFLYIIYNFPKTQAALAKIEKKNNQLVAQRFEFFFNGLELANGYFELNNENILKKRFKKILKIKKNLTLDEKFLISVNKIGNCFGIAIGFDRLMMLKHKKKNIKDILTFSYLEV